MLLLAGVGAGEAVAVDVQAMSLKSVLAFGYLVVFGSIIAFTAYVFLIKEVPVAKVSTYAYVNPVVALALGWLLAGEAMTQMTLVASAIILASVVLITTYQRPRRRLSRRKVAEREQGELISMGHCCSLDESPVSSGKGPVQSSRRSA